MLAACERSGRRICWCSMAGAVRSAEAAAGRRPSSAACRGRCERAAARDGAGRDHQRPLRAASQLRCAPSSRGSTRWRSPSPASAGRPSSQAGKRRCNCCRRPAARATAASCTTIRGFFEFFQAVTPVDVIERMQIGSRPLVRGSGSGVDTIRAVPWMFAWSQSRHMLPGWFGAGTGLAAVIERFGAGRRRRDVPGLAVFRRAAGRCRDAACACRHGHRLALRAPVPGHVERYSEIIREEYDLTRRLVLQLKGCARLLDAEPTLQRSIWLRNPYVDPIHLMQMRLLRRWRAAGSPNDKGRSKRRSRPVLVSCAGRLGERYCARPAGHRLIPAAVSLVDCAWREE